MKILTAKQTREIDAYTIANEPIKSIDLMERASKAFVTWFINQYNKNQTVLIIAGAGNNGGDALAIARLLHQKVFRVNVFLAIPNSVGSPDYQTNLNRLPAEIKRVNVITSDSEVIIDGLFGSGLTREVEGDLAQIIEKVNNTGKEIVSIDIASGLSCDNVAQGKNIIKPTYTVSFQLPKLAFMLSNNASSVGKWNVVDIGLDDEYIDTQESNYNYYTKLNAQLDIRPRGKFDHKGTFGHALIIGGSFGKIGANILASKACLKIGAGLVTTLVPTCGYTIVQTALPEIMCLTNGEKHLENITIENLSNYSVLGIGPGIGTSLETLSLLLTIIKDYSKPVVLDADALNLISQNPELIELVPKGSVLTPHVGEFHRLVGKVGTSLERVEKQRAFSIKNGLIVVLKGAHTSISDVDGTVWFNSTGNPGMATAGSGDVLTGIITGLIAQGYKSIDAARLGTYLHGSAGDCARAELGEQALIASDITERISNAFILLQ